MSLIYLRESNIEGSFLVAVYGLNSLQNNVPISDLSTVHYFPLKVSFYLLNFLANKGYTYGNFDKDFLNNYKSDFKQLSLDELAIIFFPLFLYFYRDNRKLEQELEYIETNYLSPQININSLRVFIIVINLIIEKKVKIGNFYTSIIDKIEDYTEDDLKEINIIDKMIYQKFFLTQVEEIFRENIDQNSLGIYQSIYNFFCFIDNPKFTLLRSQKFVDAQESTRILTGFLIGLNNDYCPIPNGGDIQYKGESINNIIQKFVAQWQGNIAQYI